MNSGKDGISSGGPSGRASGAPADSKHALNAGPLEDFEGSLHVDLIKARNLVKSDVIGKSDPYAILKFGKQKQKTNTINNTQDPQWDHHAEFKVPDSGADKLLVEVFDADKLGKDKSLGKAEINISDLTADAGAGHWFPLQGK
jgi:Ca2+-dependent lipid-binding protein